MLPTKTVGDNRKMEKVTFLAPFSLVVFAMRKAKADETQLSTICRRALRNYVGCVAKTECKRGRPRKGAPVKVL